MQLVATRVSVDVFDQVMAAQRRMFEFKAQREVCATVDTSMTALT